MIKSVARSVVLRSLNLDLGMLTPSWFSTNGLLHDSDLEKESVFTREVVHISTSSFMMLAVKKQITFQIKEEYKDGELSPLIEIVKCLSNLLLDNIEFNYAFFQEDEEGQGIPRLSRDLFYNPENRLNRCFDTPDAHFGLYMSKTYNSYRLRLDIKTIKATNVEDKSDKEFIMYSFTFAKPINSKEENYIDILSEWKSNLDHASEILEISEGN